MFVEPKRRKRKKGCLHRLFTLTLVLLVGWALITLYRGGVFNGGLQNYQPGDSLSASSGWENVLLFGTDSRKLSDRGRTDSIMIASVNTASGQVKLTSIMRDTMVSIPGHGTNKINAAYKFGGPELAIQTVNNAFGTNISHYVTVNFATFINVIDSIGGVDLNITEAEQKTINESLIGYREKSTFDGMETPLLKSYGKNTHLNGIQALAYSRIRYLDSDYKRAARQRSVLNALIKKAKSTYNPFTLGNVAVTALSNVETNLGVGDIVRMGLAVVTGGGDTQQLRLPADGTYESGTSEGVWSIRANLSQNQQILKEFIYGP